MNFNNLVKFYHKEIEEDTIILTDEIFCIRKYKNHPKGCPNFNKNSKCPPKVDKIKLNYDKYILCYVKFNFFKYWLLRLLEAIKTHKLDYWTSNRLKCLLYWQGAVRKILKDNVFLILEKIAGEYDLLLCGSDVYGYPSMEAVGINVFSTMRLNRVKMEVKPKYNIYLVGLIRIKLNNTNNLLI